MVQVTADVLGAPCWLSLAARPHAAESFYGAVLGWPFRRGGLANSQQPPSRGRWSPDGDDGDLRLPAATPLPHDLIELATWA